MHPHAATMQDADIYVKTDAGRDEIKSRARGLSMAVRAILLMVDGQRTVGDVRTIVNGSKAPADTLETLEAQGLIASRNGVASGSPAAAAHATSSQPAPLQVRSPAVEARPAATATVARETIDVEPSDTVLRSLASTQDLDLVLPTIAAPEVSSVPTPWIAPEPPVAAPAGTATTIDAAAEATAAGANRYEHLYTMINEVVRDFLPAHRRLLIQLKIERCSTADDLLEVLHHVRNALAKAKGEAFASDVVARLRNAA